MFSVVGSHDTHIQVLTTASNSEYKSILSPGDLPPNFLRALKTDIMNESPVCPYLEQPNTLSGLSAQSEHTDIVYILFAIVSLVHVNL